MAGEARQGHYPYQAVIDAYGNDGFRFADMSHRGSLICSPSGMTAWDVARADEVTLASLSALLEQEIDVLLIGMGSDIAPLPADIRAAFRARGVIVEAISTGSAVRTYNVLFNEHRAVAAALIAVGNAR